MATKPTKVTDWATDGAALTVATDVPRQTLGWQTLPSNLPGEIGERPNLEQQNYWQLAIHEWVQYLEQVTDQNSLPPGTILPIASNITGSHPIPATGVVDSMGYMLCDGSVIPGGQTLSGSTPDLSDGRFLQGAAISGTTGGAATINVQHSHTVSNHTHTLNNHTHDIRHVHKVLAKINSTGGGSETLYGQQSINTGDTSTTNDIIITNNVGIGAFGTFGAAASGGKDDQAVTSDGAWYTNGVISSLGGGSGNTAQSGSSNVASGGATPGTNNQLSSSQSILPTFITTQYIIKVG